MIEKFLSYLKQEKRYSENTCLAYIKDIEFFFDFIEQNFQTRIEKEINHIMIRAWLASLIENDAKTTTVNRKISALRTYFKYLKRNSFVDTNPMQKIVSPKKPMKIATFVEEEKINEMLNLGEFEEGYINFRNYLMLEIFYQTGMRLNELINIKTDDIDFIENSIKVIGKGNKERKIPINNDLSDRISHFFQLKEKENIVSLEDKNYLFLTKKGKKIYAKFVYRIVNFYLSKISTNAKKSPHVLRHTFATHMLINGADINAIKEILGHANLAATQIYTHNSINRLKQIYKQAHPRA